MLILLVVIVCLFSATHIGATTIQVPGDYSTIQLAVREAALGDTIIVGPGEYRLGYGNLEIHKKILTLKSARGAAETIIVGKQDKSVIFIDKESQVIIDGFTITSDADPDYMILKGGGIYCGPSSSPTIRNNIITGNKSVFGGAIYCAERSSPVILDNDINKNHAMTSGGGVFVFKAAPEIVRNRFVENEASNSGGAVFCNRDRTMVTNNIMWKNKAKFGGGVACDRASTAILNNTIVENSGGFYGGGIMVDGGPVRIANLILWKNVGDLYFKGYTPFSKPAYCNISDGDFKGTNGNISDDPLFTDPVNGDFTLRDESPCIDKGNPEPVYFDPDGSISDIGAYGGPKAYVEK